MRGTPGQAGQRHVVHRSRRPPPRRAHRRARAGRAPPRARRAPAPSARSAQPWRVRCAACWQARPGRGWRGTTAPRHFRRASESRVLPLDRLHTGCLGSGRLPAESARQAGVPGSLVGVASARRHDLVPSHQAESRRDPPPRGALRALRRVRVRRDGRPGVVRRLHDRGLTACSRWPPRPASADADSRARSDRPRRRQLLASRRPLPARGRVARGGRTRIRHRLGVRPDRGSDRRLRPDDRDLDRRGRECPDRLLPGPGAAPPGARPRAPLTGGRPHLVRSRWAGRVRLHDAGVPGERRSSSSSTASSIR